MFAKRLQELTPQDIERLIAEGEPEGSEVEYKRTLPDNGKGPDPWLLDQKAIGERARNALVEEVVAFANSYGGTLILGIDETDEAPHRPVGISPIPKCHDLAERLRYQIRDCVEPPIPIVEAAGVVMGEGDAGVVVIRVQPSRNAPHRHKQTRECYVRRADRSDHAAAYRASSQIRRRML